MNRMGIDAFRDFLQKTRLYLDKMRTKLMAQTFPVYRTQLLNLTVIQGAQLDFFVPVYDAAGNLVNPLTSGPAAGPVVVGSAIERAVAQDASESITALQAVLTATGVQLSILGPQSLLMRVGNHSYFALLSAADGQGRSWLSGTITVLPG